MTCGSTGFPRTFLNSARRTLCSRPCRHFFKEGIMTTGRAAGLAIVVLAGGTSTPAQAPLPPAPNQSIPILQEIVVTQAFEARVNQYVALHRWLEVQVSPLVMTPDIEHVHMSVRALALRIRIARADAHQGELIGPDVARIFRRTIATCLPADTWALILAENAEEAEEWGEDGEPPRPLPPLQVNMTWPEQLPFGYVPPELLAALPRLPAELQYRFVGSALVLWDHHANLIVDFLPDAFAAIT
jgi:hypothetical protein